MDHGPKTLRQRLAHWADQVKPLALSLAFVLIVRTVVAEPYRVPSPSMVPTLLVGDELIGSKFAYGYGKYSSPIGLLPDFSGRLFDKTPERGDVVVFDNLSSHLSDAVFDAIGRAGASVLPLPNCEDGTKPRRNAAAELTKPTVASTNTIGAR